ncbi:MAG: D-glycero-beta-D-manno-heptose 1-phosphate adenylyltransferase [Candidatus Aminicenantes bacterium]
MSRKIYRLEELLAKREELRKKGIKVVFTNGCFDILHSGHIHLFREARKWGDVLVVAVNDDGSVKKIKGSWRPIFPLGERMEILEAVDEIDYVVPFSDETPQEIIDALIPDVLVKGGDWKMGEVVGRDKVEEAGGRVVIVPYLEGHSTTEIIKKIIQAAKQKKK